MPGTETQNDIVIACEPGAGRGTWAMGSLFEQLGGPEHTGGALGVALVSQPPGIATPLHRHHNEAEAFYLLDGQMTYVAGEETYELTAGWFMYLPRGLPHGFRIRETDLPASSR